jgi:hypothetical protein
MNSTDIEGSEDPLKESTKVKRGEDEEDEGAAVDYRRIFKGYSIILTI